MQMVSNYENKYMLRYNVIHRLWNSPRHHTNYRGIFLKIDMSTRRKYQIFQHYAVKRKGEIFEKILQLGIKEVKTLTKHNRQIIVTDPKAESGGYSVFCHLKPRMNLAVFLPSTRPFLSPVVNRQFMQSSKNCYIV